MATAKQSSKHANLSEIPEGELQRLREKAKVIQSKIMLDLGFLMHFNKKPTATKAYREEQIKLTKKMTSLKLFQNENLKEQTKRRWTRDAEDGVSGQAEWYLEYSDHDETWKAVNPNKKVAEPIISFKPPPSPSFSKTKKSVETSHNHQQKAMNSKNGPAPGSKARVATAPARSSNKKKSVASPRRPKRLPPPAPLEDFYHSDETTDKKDKKNDDILILTVGGTALILATLFMIFTTIQ